MKKIVYAIILMLTYVTFSSTVVAKETFNNECKSSSNIVAKEQDENSDAYYVLFYQSDLLIGCFQNKSNDINTVYNFDISINGQEKSFKLYQGQVKEKVFELKGKEITIDKFSVLPNRIAFIKNILN